MKMMAGFLFLRWLAMGAGAVSNYRAMTGFK
jgi:hypothetical protein